MLVQITSGETDEGTSTSLPNEGTTETAGESVFYGNRLKTG